MINTCSISVQLILNLPCIIYLLLLQIFPCSKNCWLFDNCILMKWWITGNIRSMIACFCFLMLLHSPALNYILSLRLCLDSIHIIILKHLVVCFWKFKGIKLNGLISDLIAISSGKYLIPLHCQPGRSRFRQQSEYRELRIIGIPYLYGTIIYSIHA